MANVLDILSLWSSLYKTSFLKNTDLEFEYRYLEDVCFAIKMLAFTDCKLLFCPYTTYYYVPSKNPHHLKCAENPRIIRQILNNYKSILYRAKEKSIPAHKYKKLLKNILLSIEKHILEANRSRDDKFKRGVFLAVKEFYCQNKDFCAICPIYLKAALKNNDTELLFKRHKLNKITGKNPCIIRAKNFVNNKVLRTAKNIFLPNPYKYSHKLPQKMYNKITSNFDI